MALPGGYPGEVLVGVILGGLQGFQHVAKLRVVPLINVVTDDGQAPSHQAPGAAQREDGIMDGSAVPARPVSRTEGWVCNGAWLGMGLRDVHVVGIRVLPAHLLLDLLNLCVHGHFLPSLLSLLLVAVEGIAPKHLLRLLCHLVFCERQGEEKSREKLVSPLSQVGQRPFPHFQPKCVLFVLTLAFRSKTKRIQRKSVLGELILKPAFVLRCTGPRLESLVGKRQVQDCHNTNQMFKCLCLAALLPLDKGISQHKRVQESQIQTQSGGKAPASAAHQPSASNLVFHCPQRSCPCVASAMMWRAKVKLVILV